jgi:multiple sugar transport system substrate-binding protein
MADLSLSRGPDVTAAAWKPRRTTSRILVFGAALALIASACGGGATSAPATEAPTAAPGATAAPTEAPPADLGEVTIGSNYSDQVPKDAFAAMLNYCAGQTTATPKINTVEHGAFQDSLNSYLQGTPDDVFTWFAGFRMEQSR